MPYLGARDEHLQFLFIKHAEPGRVDQLLHAAQKRNRSTADLGTMVYHKQNCAEESKNACLQVESVVGDVVDVRDGVVVGDWDGGAPWDEIHLRAC